MNPSLRSVLLELAIHGNNPDIQTGIRLSLEFLEAAGDTMAAIDDLHLLLKVLEDEQESRNSLPEQGSEFSLKDDLEITTLVSVIDQLCSDLAEEARIVAEEKVLNYRIERAVL